MNKNIRKLIHEFQPQAIHIPIEKCELEETVDLLFNAMFPVCAEPDVKHIRKMLKRLHIHFNKHCQTYECRFR